jgi:hypothetical protein
MIHRIQVEGGMFELQGKTMKTNLKSHSRNKRQNLSKVLNIHECVYIHIKLQYKWSLFISRGAIRVAYAHAYHYRVLRS